MQFIEVRFFTLSLCSLHSQGGKGKEALYYSQVAVVPLLINFSSGSCSAANNKAGSGSDDTFSK